MKALNPRMAMWLQLDMLASPPRVVIGRVERMEKPVFIFPNPTVKAEPWVVRLLEVWGKALVLSSLISKGFQAARFNVLKGNPFFLNFWS